MTKASRSTWIRVLLVACACAIPAVAAADTLTLDDSGGVRFSVVENLMVGTGSSSSSSPSSASGNLQEASISMAVPVTTSEGGSVVGTLSDGFDGYSNLAITTDVANTESPPHTGADTGFFRLNGATTINSCDSREISFPTQTLLTNFSVTRRVYVPADDAFARHLDSVTNISSTVQTVYLGYRNDLGSDSSTELVTTSSGDATVSTDDTWATSFQTFSGTSSTDPRLGHVWQGTGTLVAPVMNIYFVNTNDSPFWWYTLVLQPGETARILTFVTGQPSKAAAAAKAQQLAELHTSTRALTCITNAERLEIRNFNTVCGLDSDVATACDDGNICTTDDTCSALGACTGVSSGECADGGVHMSDAGVTDDAGTIDAGLDGGAVEVDAGLDGAAVEVDAGRRDAGPATTDSGSPTTDSGSPVVDGGATFNVTRNSGCGCRVAGGDTRSTSAMLALGLLGLALVRRKRARR